jgi:hypothetical protein
VYATRWGGATKIKQSRKKCGCAGNLDLKSNIQVCKPRQPSCMQPVGWGQKNQAIAQKWGGGKKIKQSRKNQPFNPRQPLCMQPFGVGTKKASKDFDIGAFSNALRVRDGVPASLGLD